MHRPRRVVRGEVQRLEVVPVILDFRSVGKLVTQSAEDVGDPLQRAADRMQTAASAINAR